MWRIGDWKPAPARYWCGGVSISSSKSLVNYRVVLRGHSPVLLPRLPGLSQFHRGCDGPQQSVPFEKRTWDPLLPGLDKTHDLHLPAELDVAELTGVLFLQNNLLENKRLFTKREFCGAAVSTVRRSEFRGNKIVGCRDGLRWALRAIARFSTLPIAAQNSLPVSEIFSSASVYSVTVVRYWP